MKFLIDNALSPLVTDGLKSVGYDTVHVRDYGMQGASDTEILEHARNENRISSQRIPTSEHCLRSVPRSSHLSFYSGA